MTARGLQGRDEDDVDSIEWDLIRRDIEREALDWPVFTARWPRDLWYSPAWTPEP